MNKQRRNDIDRALKLLEEARAKITQRRAST